MIGAIIGDIVGSRFEYNNHRSTDFQLFTRESVFTDDTVCTVGIADWLIQSGKYGVTSGQRAAAVLATICERYPGMDYGAGFRAWITNPKPYNSFGNGAAMRVSPVAEAISGPEEEVLRYAKMATEISHNHPEGIKGAQATALAIFMARNGKSKKEIRDAITGKFGYRLNFTIEEIRATYQYNETCQETVPQAIVAFLDSADFESAIRLAVSVGGDSDTLACITGGIAEAYYKEIPPLMIQEAKKRLDSYIWGIVVEFYKDHGRRYPEITNLIIQ